MTGEAARPCWIEDPDQARGAKRPLVWVVDPADPRVPGWLARAPADRADLADLAARADAGHRLQRRGLARLLIGLAAGVHPAAIRFGRSPAGAPLVLEPGPWCLSVAGRAGWIIGVARAAIGVDLEADTGQPPLWDMLDGAERAHLADLAPMIQARGWIERWVAKEAHAKRVGNPRAQQPERLSTRPIATGFAVSGADGRSSTVTLRRQHGLVAGVALELA